MKTILRFLVSAISLSVFSLSVAAETITIATVNNGDMIRMQKLSGEFTAANPDIELEWVTR